MSQLENNLGCHFNIRLKQTKEHAIHCNAKKGFDMTACSFQLEAFCFNFFIEDDLECVQVISRFYSHIEPDSKKNLFVHQLIKRLVGIS